MKRYVLPAAIVLLTVNCVLAGWEHSAPPAGDEFLTNRFGRTWSEPIYSGYLIMDGQYIDAPYVVEQRGYVILVNNVKVDEMDVRAVLPPPPPPVVTEDPGFPTNLTRSSSLGEVVMHPVFDAKMQYFNHIGLKGQDLIRAGKDYFSAMPCVDRVEISGNPAAGMLCLYDHQGKSVEVEVGGGAPGPYTPPPDTQLYRLMMGTRSSMEMLLKQRSAVFASGGSVGAIWPGVSVDTRWQTAFDVFLSELSPEQKVSRLKALGYLTESRNVNDVASNFPIYGLKTSPQLHERLYGKESWTNDGPARLFNLTNGWQVIPPGPAVTSETNAPMSASARVERRMNLRATAAKQVDVASTAVPPPVLTAPPAPPRQSSPLRRTVLIVLAAGLAGSLLWLIARVQGRK